jgi:hypothetical protein
MLVLWRTDRFLGRETNKTIAAAGQQILNTNNKVTVGSSVFCILRRNRY